MIERLDKQTDPFLYMKLFYKGHLFENCYNSEET